MTKIALIGCTSRKKDYTCPAIEMYTESNYFNKKLEYCKKIGVEKIFILSAKYGLLDANEIIETYDLNLNKQKKDYRVKWSRDVLKDLMAKTNIKEDEFIILAGKKYVENLLEHMPNHYNPVEGLGIGQQMSYFKNYKE